ncbi:VIR protein [Plasmodium vivax]|uniref:VIR protein n=1 Tax=Plasmodium vivax TaxID=5855 RepID=A0A1G4E5V0_PLAVI|nr:VIR protein [Plasmodium vivax]
MAAGQSRHLGISSQIFPKDLPSQIVYNELETNYSDLYNYNQKCYKKLDRTNNEEVKEICKKYLRFIEKSRLWNTPNASYDVCLQVNYWIYDKLASILGSNNTENIQITFGSFQWVGENIMNTPARITYNKRCNPNIKIFNEKHWEKEKKLYEYYVDYNYLFFMAKSYDDNCEYYKKIIEIIPIYKYFEDECSPGKSNCPEFYKRYKSYNPEELLSNLKCYNQIEVEGSPKFAAATEGDSSRTEQPTRAGDPGLSQLSADLQNAKATHDMSGIGKKVSHTVLGAAPVLLTATALYKVPGFADSVEAE